MTKHEVNALATRFKATTLLLLNAGMLDEIEEIDKGIEICHTLFDDAKYEESKKMLDLVDSIIVDILEITDEVEVNPQLINTMIKEKDGYLYSLYEFDNYKYRAKFVVETNTGQLINTDVYTTNDNRSEVENLLTNSVLKKYKVASTDCKIINWSTKEQDDLTAQLIEETLKDILYEI